MKTQIRSQASTCIITRTAALLALALFLAGCVVTSVYPFYTDKDLVSNPVLPGKWVDADATNPPSEYAQIKPLDGKGYWVTLVGAQETNSMEAHLFRLKQQLFLDTFPTNRSLDYVPTHQVSKVLQIVPRLETADLNYDWLSHLLEKHPKAIRHLVLPEKPGEEGGRIVLTADTKELQRFLLKYVNNTNAWNNPSHYKRLD
ncbi:MAG: hypothetical protein KGJ60_10955 [Verrucomicrobiota bacterium]|nr:hypothetical protein [Verrucomicrobiota bacterium]